MDIQGVKKLLDYHRPTHGGESTRLAGGDLENLVGVHESEEKVLDLEREMFHK